jgi:hypothetical protein
VRRLSGTNIMDGTSYNRLPAERQQEKLARVCFYLLGVFALVYALLSGLRTIAEFDLGWQMATARWAVQHHQIPSIDVLSYTAASRPWIYPIGSGLIFYCTFLVVAMPCRRGWQP